MLKDDTKYSLLKQAANRVGHQAFFELNAIFDKKYQQKRLDEVTASILFLNIHAHRYLDRDKWQEQPATERFAEMVTELEFMDGMTPRQFMHIFPITKWYDGQGELKDYFSVIQTVKNYGLDRPIESPQSFLFDYLNPDVNIYVVDLISTMYDVNAENQEPSFLQQFFGTGGNTNGQ